MAHHLLASVLAATLASGAFVARATPITLTFDDLGVVALPGINPPSVGPFSFTSGALVISLAGPGTLGSNSDRWASSTPNALSMGPDTSFAMSLKNGGVFDFLAGHFASSHSGGSGVTIIGYADGQIVDQVSICGSSCFIPPGGSPIRVEFGWRRIDRLQFSQGAFPFGWRFVDDLEFEIASSTDVTEPPVATLLLFGLMAAGRTRVRRRTAAFSNGIRRRGGTQAIPRCVIRATHLGKVAIIRSTTR